MSLQWLEREVMTQDTEKKTEGEYVDIEIEVNCVLHRKEEICCLCQNKSTCSYLDILTLKEVFRPQDVVLGKV